MDYDVISVEDRQRLYALKLPDMSPVLRFVDAVVERRIQDNMATRAGQMQELQAAFEAQYAEWRSQNGIQPDGGMRRLFGRFKRKDKCFTWPKKILE